MSRRRASRRRGREHRRAWSSRLLALGQDAGAARGLARALPASTWLLHNTAILGPHGRIEGLEFGDTGDLLLHPCDHAYRLPERWLGAAGLRRLEHIRDAELHRRPRPRDGASPRARVRFKRLSLVRCVCLTGKQVVVLAEPTAGQSSLAVARFESAVRARVLFWESRGFDGLQAGNFLCLSRETRRTRRQPGRSRLRLREVLTT